MANSVIEICNNGLQDLGEDPVMSLVDDCKAARLCNQRWTAIRDAVLRAHPWNCCLAQAELAAGGSTPLWRWDKQFELPTDCLRVIQVVGLDGRELQDWEIQGSIILCDEEAPIFISYVRREIDPKKYDALLSEALSARLAAALAYPLSGSTSLANAFWSVYQDKLSEARGVDAREGVPEAIRMTQWLSAKSGSII